MAGRTKKPHEEIPSKNVASNSKNPEAKLAEKTENNPRIRGGNLDFSVNKLAVNPNGGMVSPELQQDIFGVFRSFRKMMDKPVLP